MKRKRGNKKGKSKGITAGAAKESISNKGSQIVEDLSGLDDQEHDNDNDNDSVMEVEVESTPSTATDQRQNVANIKSDGSIDKAMGKSVGCVKVKLKTSKTMDPQTTTSEAPVQSDTDRSSQQMGLEKKSLTAEKMEDGANSVPEIKMLVSRPAAKKSGSIKIKSSKSVGDGENQATKDGMPLRESGKLRQDSRYSKQELGSALMVIKKVMKMDAAEPFNAPVNPVALGIPDYFEVIDTPMDFGTICSNLESGVKYMNSEDVFKDVQYIWGNCYKYNNKGDYILDLMRRVKKNFSKYWTAAGLYTGPPKGSYGADNIKENVGPSSPGKVLAKGGQSKHKSWKRNGRRHKHDCLCAVCILKRRRREREANARIAKVLSGASNNDAQEFKQEGSSPIESPCAEDSSSNLEDMIDQEVDDGVEETGDKLKRDVSKSQYITPEKQEEEEEEEEEEQEEEEEEEEQEEEEEDEEEEEKETAAKKEGRAKAPEESEKKLMMQHTGQSLDDGQIDFVSPQMREHVSVDHQKRKVISLNSPKTVDSQRVNKKARVLNSFRVENPMLVDLCRILFPDDPKSVWTGPHSLGWAKHDQQRTPPTSSIRAAINTIFK